YEPQPPAKLLRREGLLLIARWQALPIRNEPDLQEVQRLRFRRVELAMENTRAGTHALHVPRANYRAIAEAVLMLELSREHVREDVHVSVAMTRKAGAGNDAVLIDDPKAPKTHVCRVAVIGEGKCVAAVQPALAALAARHSVAKTDHASLLARRQVALNDHQGWRRRNRCYHTPRRCTPV